MSEEVIAYQLIIFVFTIAASALIGPWGLLIAGVLSVIWTVCLIFTKWLFILQLITIVVSTFVGVLIISHKKFKALRTTLWQLIAVCVVLGVAYRDEIESRFWPNYGIATGTESQTSQGTPPPMPSAREPVVSYAPSGPQQDFNKETDNRDLNEVLSRIESRYPELDVNSPSFNQQLTDDVIDLQSDLIARNGLSQVDSLIMASDEVMRNYHAARRYNDVYLACISKDGIKHPPPCKNGDTKAILGGTPN